MKKQILLFGAGKSATFLIEYLSSICEEKSWRLVVADSNTELVQSKTVASAVAKGVSIDVENEAQRIMLISSADIVISLLPPTLHLLIAKDCLIIGKHLLTASYLSEAIRALKDDVGKRDILFLCEMGLDPGIDHMSAMQLIRRIRNDGGEIYAFTSHCGGLVAPETDDNPWHYKISWNPRNIVLAGSEGAVFLEQNKIVRSLYTDVFSHCREIAIKGLGKLAYYPNRNSLYYIPVYELQGISNFLRTTLRHPIFCKAWSMLIRAGLTDNILPLEPKGLRFKEWAAPLSAFADEETQPLFDYLGLFKEDAVPEKAKTAADILLYLLEKRLSMQEHDRDMVVMVHQLSYTLNGSNYLLEASLIVKGESSRRTAMAKTVGLPLGIATRLILENRITARGLHIPVLPEIYEPVLDELSAQGIAFSETITKL